MHAKETKLQDIIEGTKQYVVPLFQRTYSWNIKEWEILWNDLVELCELEVPRTHFIGSIVNMPTVSVPEGVAKYLLIDGQQRLTTIFLILTLLRNKARESNNIEFAEEINHTLLVNPFKKEGDYFKLMPTQIDRDNYKNLINDLPVQNPNQINRAYEYFERKLRQHVNIMPQTLKKIITNYFSVVSIVLDPEDNPYLVFESLNAKGRPLSQADLIRNYFFMRIHVEQQDAVYNSYWRPMQDDLGDQLTEYIRHFLMRDGNNVKKSDVYYSLKEKVTQGNAVEYLKDLCRFSKYYKKLLYPETELDSTIRKYLTRLNKIEVTTAYPLLLNLFDYYNNSYINKDSIVGILTTLENYLIRRFIVGAPSNQYNKIFPTIFPQLISKYENKFLEGFKIIIQGKGYPRDTEVKLRLKDSKLYGAGDRSVKTKLILEAIEDSFNHKEAVFSINLSIEHIMPQTLTESWKTALGEDWEITHELGLHTLGNLTLTAYNSELSNDDFNTKKKQYKNSHLELNKYFDNINNWDKEEIDKRSDYLADLAIQVWPYFGRNDSDIEKQSVTGTTPTKLLILGQNFEVKSWRDVLENTLNTIADLEPEKFEVLSVQYPRLIGKDKTKFRTARELKNNFFIEVHLEAQRIQKLCYQAMETIELSSEDDWKVETSTH
jgi:uncharacterized protein with ParB-like and HNH nuclease domain